MTGPSVGQPPPSVAGGEGRGGAGVVNIKLLLVIWQAWLWKSVFSNFIISRCMKFVYNFVEI